MSKSQSVIAKCPDCKEEFIYPGTAIRPRVTCPKCKKRFYIPSENDSKDNDSIDSKEDQSHKIPPRIEDDTKDLAHIIESIDNPVAFASAHIFKKMIETGDVRWAQLYVSVLDKTKKLDYETNKETEWLKQAKNMSMEEIVNGIAIKGTISKSMLRRLEKLEDTSPYDNI